MSNVLVIGNGFDLYHHLPTRYTDFLFFVNHWNLFVTEYAHASIETKPNKHLEISRNSFGELTEESIYDFAKYKNAYSTERLKQFEKDRNNHWVNYFNYLCNLDGIGKNWIDFEEEIQNALKCIEKYFTLWPIHINKKVSAYFSTREIDLIKEFNDGELPELRLSVGQFFNMDQTIHIEWKKRYINHMLKELNKLIKCLNIYILEFVSRIKCDLYSEQINDLTDVYLLNFNYTDTFKYAYDRSNLIANHSIHGNAMQDNIVLGIPDDSFEGTEYVYFQKYFQRIQKRTGSFYQSWLNIPYQPPIFDSPNVYIFGHSLSETDKGILKDIFINDSIQKIIIFYHSQSAYENMVINLIKLFNKDFVISNTGSERITFQELKPAKLKA